MDAAMGMCDKDEQSWTRMESPLARERPRSRSASLRPVLRVAWVSAIVLCTILVLLIQRFIYQSRAASGDAQVLYPTELAAEAFESAELQVAETDIQGVPRMAIAEIPIASPSSQVFVGKHKQTGWHVDTRCFNRQPLVGYGVGAGMDISWDMAMAREHGFKMFIFDPTPKSLAYVKPLVAANADVLTITPEGMSTEEGTLTFTLPKSSTHVSMRAGQHGSGNTVQVRVNTLRNWMARFNHTYLDVLKIDIEGSEYGVLQQLIDEEWFPFTQLLVEFHQRKFKQGSRDPRHQAVLKGLRRNGFVPFRIEGQQEYSFIKRRDLEYCLYGDVERHAQTFLPQR